MIVPPAPMTWYPAQCLAGPGARVSMVGDACLLYCPNVPAIAPLAFSLMCQSPHYPRVRYRRPFSITGGVLAFECQAVDCVRYRFGVDGDNAPPQPSFSFDQSADDQKEDCASNDQVAFFL